MISAEEIKALMDSPMPLQLDAKRQAITTLQTLLNQAAEALGELVYLKSIKGKLPEIYAERKPQSWVKAQAVSAAIQPHLTKGE